MKRKVPRSVNMQTPGGIASIFSERCGKLKYSSRRYARQAARSHHGDPVREYLCQDCDGWHVGHLPASVRLGAVTSGEYYEQSQEPVHAVNLPEAMRRARHTAAGQVGHDRHLLAQMWADHTIGDRSEPDWEAERRFADELLGWLPGVLKHLPG